MSRYWIEVMKGEKTLLGSDGTIPLDGRFSFETAVAHGYDYCEKLQGIKPWITGFRIARGDSPSTLGRPSLPFTL